MKERPILFSAPMVRALLDDRKTQTRRIVNPQPSTEATGAGVFTGGPNHGEWCWLGGDQTDIDSVYTTPEDKDFRCPYGTPADRLWVRETWQSHAYYDNRKPSEIPQNAETVYAADGGCASHWRTSLFMPRWASRITLEITDVRVEHLQDISENDAAAEGVFRVDGEVEHGWTFDGHLANYAFASSAYRKLWDSINGEGAWGKNPWVWAVSFRRVEVC